MAGDGQFPFNSDTPPEVNIELGVYIDELTAARELTLDKTPRFKENPGLPEISDKLEVLAEFTEAVCKIDRYDSPIISRAQLANLVAINEHVTAMLVPPSISTETAYGELLINNSWAADIEDIGQDLDYIEAVREVAGQVSLEKIVQINMMRFASRIWLDRFSEEEKSSAQFAAVIIFGNYFSEALDDIREQALVSVTPEDAYLIKIDGYERISNYCFAGVPMSREEAREYSVMSRRAF